MPKAEVHAKKVPYIDLSSKEPQLEIRQQRRFVNMLQCHEVLHPFIAKVRCEKDLVCCEFLGLLTKGNIN